jgi:hypothetical protein
VFSMESWFSCWASSSQTLPFSPSSTHVWQQQYQWATHCAKNQGQRKIDLPSSRKIHLLRHYPLSDPKKKKLERGRSMFQQS